MISSVPIALGMSGWRWSRLRGRWHWSARADLGLALVCFVVGQIEVATIHTHGEGFLPAMVLSAAMATLPIAWRRHAPLAASLVVAVGWALYALWGGADGIPCFSFAVLPLLYSVGAHPNVKRAIGGLAAILAAWTVTHLREAGFVAFQVAVIWVSGRAVRVHRLQSEQLRVLAQRLETERAATERLAIARERQRIACELHDSIGHAISTMVIQAAGAGQVLGRQPNRARIALSAVQDNGRAVIMQLQRVLRLLRTSPDTSEPVIDSSVPEPSPGRLHPGMITWWAWADLLLALSVIVFAESELILIDQSDRIPMPIVVSSVATFLAIIIWRRAPITALLIATATTADLLLQGREIVGALVAMMLAIYSVAADKATRRGLCAVVTAVVMIHVLALITVGAGALALIAVWLGIPWFLGRYVRNCRRRAERLRTLTRRLEQKRDARARLAVLAQRAKVARDLHHSLGHAINVMVLQAGGAEQVLNGSPERAREAIRVIGCKGRQASTELCHLLGLLDRESLTPRTPQPSLSQLDTLLDQARTAGLPIILQVIGPPVRLPADLDISAYRIVQEGITNTVKHAGPVSTTVTLEFLPGALDIEIRDVGTSQPPPNNRTGHGLLGMRERTILCGGTMEAGPRPGGGFVVRAHFPLNPADS